MLRLLAASFMGFALGGWSNASGATNATGQCYAMCQSSMAAASANEIQVQYKIRTPGRFSLLTNQVNNVGTARSLKFRINGGNGSQSVAMTDSTAGTYRDAVNTDLVVATDLINTQLTVTSGPTTINWIASPFWANSGHVCLYNTANINFTAASTTSFLVIAGGSSAPAAAAVEANMKFRMRVAGTLQSAQSYVSAARATSSTVRSRIDNGGGSANGNIVYTLTGGATGLFEDTSNSDAFSAGYDVNWSITTGTGVDTLSITTFGGAVSTTGAGPSNDIFASTPTGNARAASGTATFYQPIGRVLGGATEANMTLQHGFPVNTSRFRLFLSLNTYVGNGTARLRKNVGDGNQTFTITLSVPGLFEDTSNTDALTSTDTLNYSIIDGTAGSITATWFGLTEQDNTPEIGALYENIAVPFGLTNQSAGSVEGLSA